MVGVNPNLPYIVNYPGDWLREYEENKYNEIDPVLKYAATTMEAFSWKMLKDDPEMTPKVRRFWRRSEMFGLSCGITVPLHCPTGMSFGFSLSAIDMKSCFACIHLEEIQLVAYQFCMAYLLANKSHKRPDAIIENPLSDREKEILTWTARGKSAWEISVILEISEHTVNFHLKNSIKKLDTSNKTGAVVKAIRYGLIFL